MSDVDREPDVLEPEAQEDEPRHEDHESPVEPEEHDSQDEDLPVDEPGVQEDLGGEAEEPEPASVEGAVVKHEPIQAAHAPAFQEVKRKLVTGGVATVVTTGGFLAITFLSGGTLTVPAALVLGVATGVGGTVAGFLDKPAKKLKQLFGIKA